MLASIHPEPSPESNVPAGGDALDLFAHRALPYVWVSVLAAMAAPYLFFRLDVDLPETLASVAILLVALNAVVLGVRYVVGHAPGATPST